MKFLVEQAFGEDFGRNFGVGLRGSAMVEKSLEQARQRFAVPSYSGNDCCTSRIRAWPGRRGVSTGGLEKERIDISRNYLFPG
jgi:hypothetical protein